MTTSSGDSHSSGSNGETHRLSSEYEYLTHGLDRAIRHGRSDAAEASARWPDPVGQLMGRLPSPLHCDEWHGFSDPDELTYGRYVTLQDNAETVLGGVLDEYDRAAHDSVLGPDWLDALAVLLTPLRYPLYGLQQAESFLVLVAPSSNAANAAAFAAADLLRATSAVAQRTWRLQMRNPARSFAIHDRSVWEDMGIWQPTRRAVEATLATSNFGEALTAVNLMLWPALDSVLFRSFGQVARANEDHLTWLLLASLAKDAERNRRWSTALARYAVRQRPANEECFQSWVAHWGLHVLEAVEPLAATIADLPRAMSADDITGAAVSAVAASLAATRADTPE
ncbi:MAG: toluene hydroxylase [bacterium]|nr:toluene hydroxylase [bacterium]